MARTAGIDFLSQTVSLWEKELPEQVDILLHRAASNLKYGYPADCARDLAKVYLLDPANQAAATLRRLAGLAEPAHPEGAPGGTRAQRASGKAPPGTTPRGTSRKPSKTAGKPTRKAGGPARKGSGPRSP
jgi:hypothetical protein